MKVDKEVVRKLDEDLKQIGEMKDKELIDKKKLQAVYLEVKRLFVEHNLELLEARFVLAYMLDEVKQVLDFGGLHKLKRAAEQNQRMEKRETRSEKTAERQVLSYVN